MISYSQMELIEEHVSDHKIKKELVNLIDGFGGDVAKYDVIKFFVRHMRDKNPDGELKIREGLYSKLFAQRQEDLKSISLDSIPGSREEKEQKQESQKSSDTGSQEQEQLDPGDAAELISPETRKIIEERKISHPTNGWRQRSFKGKPSPGWMLHELLAREQLNVGQIYQVAESYGASHQAVQQALDQYIRGERTDMDGNPLKVQIEGGGKDAVVRLVDNSGEEDENDQDRAEDTDEARTGYAATG